MPNFKKILAGLASAAIIAAYAAPIQEAFASVSLTAAPTSAITSPTVLPASSSPTVLFNFSLNATAGESLNSVSVQVDKANTITNVTGTHVGTLAVYKDNGDGVFNASTDSQVGSQSVINIGSPTTIGSSFTVPASGMFFVTLSTAPSWTAGPPADSIMVTFPFNGITTSANSPVATQVQTPSISASSMGIAPTVLSQTLSLGTASINQAVFDTANLSNTNGSAGGTVTYNVYLGSQCSGAATFSDNEPVSFNQAASSKGFATTATGGYSWQAFYSGDVNNTSATSSCATEYVGLTAPNDGGFVAGATTAPPASLPVTGMDPLALLLILGLGSGAAFLIKKGSLN